LPLDLIFGRPLLHTDENGNEFYPAKFGLTNGA
jgi:hypothetical protein